jgi:nitroreductase
VRNNDRRKVLSKGLCAKFLTQAPLVIVACGDKKASPDWYAMDVALAVENMISTAVREELGICCVGSFGGKEVKETIKAPENFEVLLLLAVCYIGEKLDLSKQPFESCT